jgi:hypothetical protein
MALDCDLRHQIQIRSLKKPFRAFHDHNHDLHLGHAFYLLPPFFFALQYMVYHWDFWAHYLVQAQRVFYGCQLVQQAMVEFSVVYQQRVCALDFRYLPLVGHDWAPQKLPQGEWLAVHRVRAALYLVVVVALQVE